MAISSTSTQADAIAQYLDNLGYDHPGSVAAAKLFIQACRALLVLHPGMWKKDESTIEYDPALWRKEQTDAREWLAQNDTSGNSGSVRHLTFGSDFR